MKKLAVAGGGAVFLALGGGVILLVVAAVALASLLSGAAAVNSLLLIGQKDKDVCSVTSGAGVPVTGTQQDYVRTMIGVAKTMGVSERGQIIAVMTMLQESGIKNYANSGKNARGYNIGTPQGTQFWLDAAKLSMAMPHDAVGNDADSVGLYQQRASAGWANSRDFKAAANPEAAIRRLMDPRWGAEAFFGGPKGSALAPGLLGKAGWESKSLSAAAQSVQGSAFPDAYAKWETQATQLVRANQDAPAAALVGGGAPASNDTVVAGATGTESVEWPMAEGTYRITSTFGSHNGIDLAGPLGTPIYAAADGVVVKAAPTASGYANWVVIDHNLDGKKYSTLHAHMQFSSILVKVGDTVTKGQQIASVGDEGNSSGPHLHFEVWDGGRFDGGTSIDPQEWLKAPHSGGGGNVECGTGVAAPSVDASGTVAAVIDSAYTQLGVPYSWGGGSLTGPSDGFAQGRGITGFDCSSLMRYAVYNGTGKSLELPRVAAAQYQYTKGSPVEWDAMEPGDLIFWSNGGASAIYHVAMYVGNGQMVEAPRTGIPVRVTGVYRTNFYGATRINYGG